MKRILLIAAAALALTGCNKTNTETNDDRTALDVTSTITRVADDKWDAGDKIGIFMLDTRTQIVLATDYRYTTTAGDGKFTPTALDQTIYFPLNSDEKVDFVAYYPCDAVLATTSVAVDVTTQADQTKLDHMTAVKVTGRDKTNPAVAFTFGHRMARISLEVTPGTGLTPDDLKGATYSITEQYTEGTLDLNTGAVTAIGDKRGITMKSSANGLTAEATLIPAGNEAGRRLTFALSNGDTYYYELPDSKSFTAGENTLYKVTLNRVGAAVTATIVDWTYKSEDIELDAIEVAAVGTDYTWDGGASIGIFMFDSEEQTLLVPNSRYRTVKGDGAFAPFSPDQTIYFPVDASQAVDFAAYHPYDADQTGTGIVVEASNQFNQKSLDYMTADMLAGRDKTNPALPFEFRHRMTRITLNVIAGTGLTAADMKDIAVSITGQYVSGTLDITTGVITTSGDAVEVAMKTSSDGKIAEATLIPSVGTSGRQLVFRLAGGDTYYHNLSADKSFGAGEHIHYDVRISRVGISVSAKIIDWTDEWGNIDVQ